MYVVRAVELVYSSTIAYVVSEEFRWLSFAHPGQ